MKPSFGWMCIVRRSTLIFALGMTFGCANQVRQNPLPQTELESSVVPFVKLSGVDRKRYEAIGSDFMIATQGDATTRGARAILAKGGNIYDAAAAASFLISVERPESTGIGGGGFMLMYHAASGKAEAVDFREKAPLAATEKMYLDPKGEVIPGASRNGARAVGVPGMVAGVLAVHAKYGKLKRAAVLQPAIDLAQKGFHVHEHLAKAIEERADELWKNADARRVFFKGPKPLQVGDLIRQPDLARTLQAIAKRGRSGFYKGWVANAFLKEQKRLGGLVSAKDMDKYDVKYREPVSGSFKGYRLISMPPPSSGGIHVVQILNILSGFPLNQSPPFSVTNIHRTVAAMQLAFRDRATYLGDTDFVRVPVQGLLSAGYADKLRSSISDRAQAFEPKGAVHPKGFEPSQTAHFSIADKKGNLIASTQTINGWFGAGVVVPKAGFVMNNEMDDFSVKPGVPNAFGVIGGPENAIQPGKRPLSSMSPTLVLRDGKPVMALGSPAGSHIITCVALTLLNYLAYEMPLYDSVAALRYHHQWTPQILRVEPPGFPEGVALGLQELGYQVETKSSECRVEAVAIEKGVLHGVSDPRGEGLSASERPIGVSAP